MYFEFETCTVPFLVELNFGEVSPIPHINPHIELIYMVEGELRTTADANTQILRPGELFPDLLDICLAVRSRGKLQRIAAQSYL